MPYAKTPVTANELFVQGLVREVPELAPALQEHVEFYEELLPHVLMGDVGRFVVANAISRDSKAALARLMAYLEEGLANGPAEVQELIVASFVEYLQDEASTILTLAPVMGPRLKKEINAICGPYLSGEVL